MTGAAGFKHLPRPQASSFILSDIFAVAGKAVKSIIDPKSDFEQEEKRTSSTKWKLILYESHVLIHTPVSFLSTRTICDASLRSIHLDSFGYHPKCPLYKSSLVYILHIFISCRMKLFYSIKVLWLALIYLTSPTVAQQKPLNNHESVSVSTSQWNFNFSSSAPHYFASAYGLLQQWSNTFFPNGHSIVPCEIPPLTKLYHGRRDADVPPSPEWVAFDM